MQGAELLLEEPERDDLCLGDGSGRDEDVPVVAAPQGELDHGTHGVSLYWEIFSIGSLSR